MNTRVSLIALIFLAACAQTPTPVPLKSIVVQQAPLPNYFWKEPAPSNQPPATACLLGTSCMTMDDRPFETCLVGGRGKRCGDKLAEFMLVSPRVVPGRESGENAAE